MKRIALGLAGFVLSVSLVGCGGGGVDEGMPADQKPGVPLDPNMVNMKTGSFADQKKAAVKNAAAAKLAPITTPEKTE
jgi:hypothetical protein